MKFLENLLPTIATTGIYIDINYNWDPAPPYIPDMKLNLPGYIENSEDSDSDRLEMQTVSDRPNQAHLTDIGIYNKAITTPQHYTFEIHVLSPTNHIIPDISIRDI